MPHVTTTAPGYRQITAMAIPIILANSATPLLGLVDTAVIGNLGTVTDLGAIALGSLLFNFIFWGFGFLRMSTSGFVAQATGRGDALETLATIARGLLLAVSIGTILLLLQWPLINLALRLFGAGSDVEAITREFFHIRIWGAPAALSLYVLTGYFIGRGATRTLLVVQLVLNGLNIALDIIFAGVFGWGARGIALGTALAEWITLVFAAALVWRGLRADITALRPALKTALLDRAKLRKTLGVNLDILVRTLFLLLGFAIFTDRGARFGDEVLAANHILLQLISFSAFFLDGFAFVTEALVGRALGARQPAVFAQVVRRSSVLAAITALLLCGLLLAGGGWFIAQLTSLEAVRNTALHYLPWCALYVLVSFAAFQFDGIFIGATRTRALRNAAVVSTLIFIAAAVPLAGHFGNSGLWWAFILFVAVRAATLAAHYPGSFAGIGAGQDR